MRHTVNLSGEVTLHPTPQEIETLSNVLSQRHHVIPKHQFTEEALDRIISMMTALQLASLESNRIKAQAFITPNPVIQVDQPRKASLNKRLYDFFYTDFSIAEIEFADSRCGALIHIESMDFHEGNMRFPYLISGKIQPSRCWYDATWDSKGKCSCPQLRNFQHRFDLVRPEKSKSDSAKIIIWATSIFLTSLLICAAFYLIKSN